MMLTESSYIIAIIAGAVLAWPFYHHDPANTRTRRSPGTLSVGPSSPVNTTQILPRQFEIPCTLYVPDSDPNKQDHAAQLRQAWVDAVQLAAFTHAAFEHSYPPINEDVFDRYFQEGNQKFVQNVFGVVGKYHNPDNLDTSKLENLRSVVGNGVDYSEKFSELTLSWRDHPDIPENERYCGQNEDPDHPWTHIAYLWQFDDMGNRAIINVCDTAFRFPQLSAIEQNVPATWTADPGCAGLGDEDTGWMTSLGGHLLHEFTHWEYLTKDIPGFEDVVEKTPDKIIGDYKYELWREEVEDEDFSEDPSTGYGPFKARELNFVTETKNLGQRNADNYRWYAQSKYWSFKCERDFATNDGYTGGHGDILRYELDH